MLEFLATLTWTPGSPCSTKLPYFFPSLTSSCFRRLATYLIKTEWRRRGRRRKASCLTIPKIPSTPPPRASTDKKSTGPWSVAVVVTFVLPRTNPFFCQEEEKKEEEKKELKKRRRNEISKARQPRRRRRRNFFCV